MSETPQTNRFDSAEAYLRHDLHRYLREYATELRELADRVERHASDLDSVGRSSSTSYAGVAADVLRDHTAMLANSSLRLLISYSGQADYVRGRGE